METSQEFTVRKRICTAADGYQFITSGFPNRSRGGRAFESVDGLWAIDLLPGLGPREADMENPNGNRSPRQGIAVDLHVSRVEREGYRKMWVFGFVGRSRCITEYRPRSVERGEDSTTRGDQERLGVYRAVAGPRPLPRHRGGVGVPRLGSSREN